MSARPDTWMPFYIGDYMADTMHLSRDQHGAYFMLICAYWRNGAPLIDDDGLATIAKATAKEWQKLRPVMARFFIVGDGVWRHKRIDAELKGALDKTDKRSKAGAEGARRRWQSDSNAIANPSQNDACAETPSPSPSQSITPNPAERGFSENKSREGSPRSEGTNPRAQGTNPRAKAADVEYEVPWPARCRSWADGKRWDPMWGPEPSDQNCHAPPNVVAKARRQKAAMNGIGGNA